MKIEKNIVQYAAQFSMQHNLVALPGVAQLDTKSNECAALVSHPTVFGDDTYFHIKTMSLKWGRLCSYIVR